ncbi:TPM domain-containing protein [Reyranella sp.]|uniref:TPM domain-containing protein n=1 Tax=Reyranella sp. TaxID=1929291 RepID=UPI00272F8B76|nr:TPM domain-containing protein [Reyranella sp.]MDP2375423.1 TPM domain-containing protein [Reyranella sp.]
MDLSERDRARLSDAIRASEARTTGEIVCVLARTSAVEATTALPVLIAAVVSLALPWLLMAFTTMSLQLMLSLQILAFLGLLALSCLPRVRVALIPRAARRALAHRLAMEQFVVRGVARTKERTGILIFVSLAERYARIIADEGIAARVPQSHWQGAIDMLVGHMREGRVADGFVAAIDTCGAVLATHFPVTGTEPSELPDRIYLI